MRAKRWGHMGLLEVNNVCDGGADLWRALKEVYYANASVVAAGRAPTS